ncbi:AraC family transcriptional regulator [Dysgonomonas sp. 520]|uniref:helix-turn-helix domain-containing protein n=1 Tax=Dysgonomonas sp. 520 TaxID=2302931 RepID=UPI0013D3030A|nr:helix-turn-helix transcriptional regulator [Dysgonomonas sp. 520]NDW09730.1 AraC family transcriptional regulator [Dysgonomonas sp. 520]
MKHENDSSIDFIQLERGQALTLESGENKIILVTEGKIYSNSSTHDKVKVTSSNMVFYPFLEQAEIKVEEKSEVVLIRFKNESDLCSILSSITAVEATKQEEGNTITLPVKQIIYNYIDTIKKYQDKSIYDDYLQGLKIKEFGYILKNFYSKEQLQNFFKMFSVNDSLFTEEVCRLSSHVRSIRQLAERMNYSYSGFNKRFRRVFNTSAYSWMRDQRAKQVYQDICQTNKSLKEISTNYNFATLSHFNEFCHKNLGCSPSEIRRKNSTKQYL